MQEPPITVKRPVSWGRWIAIGIAMLILLIALLWFVNSFVVLPNEVAVIDVGEVVSRFEFVNDQTLVGVDLDGGVYRIEAFPSESSKLLFTAPGRATCVLSIPDRSAVAIGTEDGLVVVIDLDGTTLHQWSASDGGTVFSLAYSPQRQLLLAAAHDGVSDSGDGGNLSLWSLRTGEKTAFHETLNRTPMGAAIDEQRGVAVVAFYYGEVSIISLDDLTTLREVEIETINPPYGLNIYDMSLNAAETLIGVAASDSIVVVDAVTLQVVARRPVPGIPVCVDWNAATDEIFYCGYDCGVARWNPLTNEAELLADESYTLHNLDVSPSGKYLAITRGGIIRLAELVDGQ